MSTYIGTSAETVYGEVQNRYFYGLRRTDNGELFLGKVDQLKKTDSLTINNPGDPTENYPNFEEGQDFYEGRDVYHNLVYENLNYEQFRWDDRNVLYYINDEGELILRINQNHTYTDGDSSNGL
jgi:uncharacterized UPF0160 family protein